MVQRPTTAAPQHSAPAGTSTTQVRPPAAQQPATAQSPPPDRVRCAGWPHPHRVAATTCSAHRRTGAAAPPQRTTRSTQGVAAARTPTRPRPAASPSSTPPQTPAAGIAGRPSPALVRRAIGPPAVSAHRQRRPLARHRRPTPRPPYTRPHVRRDAARQPAPPGRAAPSSSRSSRAESADAGQHHGVRSPAGGSGRPVVQQVHGHQVLVLGSRRAPARVGSRRAAGTAQTRQRPIPPTA